MFVLVALLAVKCGARQADRDHFIDVTRRRRAGYGEGQLETLSDRSDGFVVGE